MADRLTREQIAGWATYCRDGDLDFFSWSFETQRHRPRGGAWRPVWVVQPVEDRV